MYWAGGYSGLGLLVFLNIIIVVPISKCIPEFYYFNPDPGYGSG